MHKIDYAGERMLFLIIRRHICFESAVVVFVMSYLSAGVTCV